MPDIDVTVPDTATAMPVFVVAVSKAAFIDPNVVITVSDVPVSGLDVGVTFVVLDVCAALPLIGFGVPDVAAGHLAFPPLHLTLTAVNLMLMALHLTLTVVHLILMAMHHSASETRIYGIIKHTCPHCSLPTVSRQTVSRQTVSRQTVSNTGALKCAVFESLCNTLF